MIRTALLSGFATLALLSAPAKAQNVSSMTNTAAGIGNVANQQVMTKQATGRSVLGTATYLVQPAARDVIVKADEVVREIGQGA